MTTVRLSYDRGTLLLDCADSKGIPSQFVFDERIGTWRAPGDCYRTVFADLFRALGNNLKDEAREYGEIELGFRARRQPYAHQREAVKAWIQAQGRGLVVLPTGSGKTFVAELAISKIARTTLVIVPTIDLMNQWYAGLLAAFRVEEVGLIGGGYHDIRNLTVTTYDSFSIHAERLGHRFGLLVFDECHHLPGPSYAQASRCYIAPYRLGLTATPERDGETDAPYVEIIGPIVYSRQIKELAGEHLAEYETRQISVELDDRERAEYDEARSTYLGFLREMGIKVSARNGWARFIQLSSLSRAGRQAMLGYREQRRIAMTCRAKLETLEILLTHHAQDRVLIFTNDNLTAYRISVHFLVPTITHQTPVRERKQILEQLRGGEIRVVVTSKVLNEGVDIPAANVAIVLSGSGSVREHVQRLGRILRRAKDKQAVLYELVANNTMEQYVSERRRDHDAYR